MKHSLVILACAGFFLATSLNNSQGQSDGISGLIAVVQLKKGNPSIPSPFSNTVDSSVSPLNSFRTPPGPGVAKPKSTQDFVPAPKRPSPFNGMVDTTVQLKPGPIIGKRVFTTATQNPRLRLGTARLSQPLTAFAKTMAPPTASVRRL